jgi:HAE1 family hydrophobic/amphiphilic exporter-1
LTATIVVKGQLTSPEEFGRIVLKSKQDGSVVRVADVARVEIGRDDYSFYSRLNGRPAATVGIQLGPRGNALETSTRFVRGLPRYRRRCRRASRSRFRSTARIS